MTTTTATSLSFQPWTRDNTEENSLKDVLARVNVERGHFRDITEASLQEEIAAEGGLVLSDSEEDEDEDEEDEEPQERGKSKPSTREDLFRAKYEMLASVKAAEQDILMSLDFVSLLLSKHAPRQATTTISPVLKEAVPLGSLGTDLWQRMPVDKAREAQDEIIAANVRMEGLQKSADALLSAASRLQDNVRKETQYWNQVLSISEEGWNVSRVPGQHHRLGVRFGFSGSAPEFSRRGIAALNAGPDGIITLERGIGSKPKALRTILRKRGNVFGISKLPDPPDAEETTLEARIRHARDSLYDEELYHEIIRESRTLASLGVGMKGSAIEFGSNSSTDSNMHVSFDLVSLDEDHGSHADLTQEGDALAQNVALAARLLLSQAHRDRLKKRSEIPAPVSEKQKDEKPPLPILRPIMSFFMHGDALESLNSYISTVSNILKAAHVQNTFQSARFKLPENLDITSAETLIATLMRPWISEAEIKLTLADNTELTFSLKVETTLAYGFGSVFTLILPSRPGPYRFESFDELVTATDAKLASALANAVGDALGDEWRCNGREALVVKDVGLGEKREDVWVIFDSRREMLSLKSLVKKVSWNVNEESPEKGFWEAVHAVVEAPK